MKISFGLAPKRPLRPSEAWTYALINQFATPGLGSLMARRFIAGSGQLLLAVAGFCLLIFWMIQKLRVYYGQMFGTALPADTGNVAGKWGLILFAASWLWSLVSSIQIILAAKDEIQVPPRIT